MPFKKKETESKPVYDSRPPEYRVSLLDKGTARKGSIGAAWKNPDGSIAVKLDAFVVMPPSHNCVITLFPNKPPKYKYKGEEQDDEHGESGTTAGDDPPIPGGGVPDASN